METAFSIGNLEIHWYGIMIAVGVVAWERSKHKGARNCQERGVRTGQVSANVGFQHTLIFDNRMILNYNSNCVELSN